MASEFGLVTNRQEFFRQLGICIAAKRRFFAKDPTVFILDPISRQLEAVRNWTLNGRKPTFDERRSISMGRTVQRELEGTPDPAWSRYQFRISELSNYFKLWRSDAGLNGLDENDWRT